MNYSSNYSKLEVEQVRRIWRSRWKIENETFNTLKNRGYNFDHNFGHDFKELYIVIAQQFSVKLE